MIFLASLPDVHVMEFASSVSAPVLVLVRSAFSSSASMRVSFRVAPSSSSSPPTAFLLISISEGASFMVMVEPVAAVLVTVPSALIVNLIVSAMV